MQDKEHKGLEGTFGAHHLHGYSFIKELKSALMNTSMTLKSLHQLTFQQFIFRLLNKILFFSSDRLPFYLFVCFVGNCFYL